MRTFRGILILLLALIFLPCCHFRLHSTPLAIDNWTSEDGGYGKERYLGFARRGGRLKVFGNSIWPSRDLPEQRLGILWVSMTKCWYRILHRKSKAWGVSFSHLSQVSRLVRLPRKFNLKATIF